MGLIGSALGAVGSIFGGISASKAMKNAKKMSRISLRKIKTGMIADITKMRHSELTHSACWLSRRRASRIAIRAAAGTQAVMGGTEESTAAAKAANNQALADATAQIAINGEQRKDAIEGQYLQNKQNLNNQLNQIEMGKAQAISGAVQGVASAAGDMDFGTIKTGKNKTISL